MTVKLKRIKLYYMYELGHPMYSPVQSEMKSAIDRIVGHMKESHGVEAVQVKLLGLEEAFDVYVYEMKNHPVASLSYAMKLAGAAPVGPGDVWPHAAHLHIILSIIEKFSADKDDPLFIRCVQLAQRMRDQVADLLGSDGILLTPLPPHPEVAPKHKTTILKLPNCMYTAVFNLLEVAITECPMGLSKQGIPLGVQVIAGAGNDHLTLAMAEEIEKTFGGWSSPSSITCWSFLHHSDQTVFVIIKATYGSIKLTFEHHQAMFWKVQNWKKLKSHLS